MGGNKGRYGKSQVQFTNFLMLGREMVLHCDEWKQLSSKAKVLYLMLKAKYNGSNNGEIVLPYTELEAVEGFRSHSTASMAFKELCQKGWITVTGNGGLYRNPNRYGFTRKYDEYFKDRSLTPPGKYKKSTYSVTQYVPPVGYDALGLKIYQPVSPASDPVRTTESVAVAPKKCS